MAEQKVKDLHKIKIHLPTTSNSTVAFLCQFTDKKTGKLKSIIDNGRDGYFHEGDLTPAMSVRTIIFDRKTMLEFWCDKNDMYDPNTKNYLNYWTKDPRVLAKSGIKNDNHEITELVMEDLTAQKTENVITIKDKRKASQKYETLSISGIRAVRNVAYYFGVTKADKMNEDDLYVHMLDPVSGILMQGDNITKFLNYESNDENIQLQINTRRAIEKGFVEAREQFGKMSYFINNHPVGDSEDSVIAYLDLNKDFYFQYIIEKLGDEAEIERIEKSKPPTEVIEVTDTEALRAVCKAKFEQLKALGIKNSKAARYAQYVSADADVKLKDAIKEADELLKDRTPVIETQT